MRHIFARSKAPSPLRSAGAVHTARGERIVLVAEDESSGVVGTVPLLLTRPDHQSHRADVAKLRSADFPVRSNVKWRTVFASSCAFVPADMAAGWKARAPARARHRDRQ